MLMRKKNEAPAVPRRIYTRNGNTRSIYIPTVPLQRPVIVRCKMTVQNFDRTANNLRKRKLSKEIFGQLQIHIVTNLA